MKQIDYFKFLKAFPEFIDIDDKVEVKLVLLNEIRKKTWRKKEKSNLLPIKIIDPDGYQPVVEYLKKSDLMNDDFKFKIMYKKELLITIYYVKRMNGWLSHIEYNLQKLNNSMFMEKEEITNLKRTLLIDKILYEKI